MDLIAQSPGGSAVAIAPSTVFFRWPSIEKPEVANSSELVNAAHYSHSSVVLFDPLNVPDAMKPIDTSVTGFVSILVIPVE